jgi:hypothetical protein
MKSLHGVAAVGLALAGLACAAAHAAEPPWPADVEGWVAPKAGEHPRLLFRKADLPALRKRARTPEGQAILKRLRATLGGGEAMPANKNPMTSAYGKRGGPKPGKTDLPLGTYSLSHVAGFGFLYQITGEQKYADLGKQCFEWAFEGVRDRDREARYAWDKPGGALRAGPSIGWYAVGYDLCYDGWDDAFRQKVAQAIQSYDGNDPKDKNTNIENLARGARHMPGSNHWGMQVGGAALALLAIRNDPGVDADKVEKMLAKNAPCMIRNMTEGFGDHGWFAEGDGTGSMSSHIVFLPALQAWRVAGGKDYITPRPNAPWLTLKWIFLTVPRKGKMDFPGRGAYPHNIWDRDGISGAGYFAEGFGAVHDAQKAALLWLYETHLAEADAAAGTPFDTVSPYPHHAILAFVNWPFGLKAANPAGSVPRAARDAKFGFYMFRNRWQDENDIVISIQTKGTRGWHKANTDGGIQVWGMGKKQKWGRVRGDVSDFKTAADGSAILAAKDGTGLAVDFSKASGADGMLVMTGPGAPGDAKIEAGGTAFSFLFLTSGAKPTPRAEGDKVVVGGQTVSFADGRIVLGKMEGPMPDKPEFK